MRKKSDKLFISNMNTNLCYRCGHSRDEPNQGCSAWGKSWKRHWYPKLDGRCSYCGRPFSMKVDNVEEKLESALGLEHGKEICRAIERKEFRSIDLCNFHYTLLRVYKNQKRVKNE